MAWHAEEVLGKALKGIETRSTLLQNAVCFGMKKAQYTTVSNQKHQTRDRYELVKIRL